MRTQVDKCTTFLFVGDAERRMRAVGFAAGMRGACAGGGGGSTAIACVVRGLGVGGCGGAASA